MFKKCFLHLQLHFFLSENMIAKRMRNKQRLHIKGQISWPPLRLDITSRTKTSCGESSRFTTALQSFRLFNYMHSTLFWKLVKNGKTIWTINWKSMGFGDFWQVIYRIKNCVESGEKGEKNPSIWWLDLAKIQNCWIVQNRFQTLQQNWYERRIKIKHLDFPYYRLVRCIFVIFWNWKKKILCVLES